MQKFWTKLHTVLGITAGVVLCVIGVTGALQSFEEELLHLFNGRIFQPEISANADSNVNELFAKVQTALPEKRIVSWQARQTPGYPIRVGYTAREQQPAPEAGAKREKPRTEYRYLDPTSGALYPPLRGEKFFRTVNDIHRRLAAGDWGKRIVGASVLCLVVLCLSGLYLRWPHNPLNWRNWFRLDFKLKGRRFLRDLHMMTGTWLLLLYLSSALTGLYWSYDWYKNGLYSLTGTTPPVREIKLEEPALHPPDIGKLWQVLLRESGGSFHDATLRLPEKKEHAVEIRYLDANPPHNRAFNRLFLDSDSGMLVARELYAEKSAGAKFMASIFPLHTGNFFGLPGILLLMISSLLMPLFGITGWKMYLDRHRREHGAGMARAQARRSEMRNRKIKPEE